MISNERNAVAAPEYKQLYNVNAFGKNGIYKKGVTPFKVSPMEFHLYNFDYIFKYISNVDGLKVRVPVNSFRQLFEYSKTLPLFYDHVVFSPAQLFPSCHGHQYRNALSEFSFHNYSINRGKYGITSFNSDVEYFFKWLIEAKPLIEKGIVSYLPKKGVIDWDYEPINLPNPEIAISTKEALRLRGEDIIAWALLLGVQGQCMESVVSYKMGCQHLINSVKRYKLPVSDIPIYDLTSDNVILPILLRLKIPWIKNIRYSDLAKILEDEYESFSSFRNGIHSSIKQIEANIHPGSDIDRIVSRIKRETIDDPLYRLEHKLRRITKYSLLKIGGYSVGAFAMALSVHMGTGLWATISSGIGGVSLYQVYKSYVEYLENCANLKESSVYYLLKMKEKAGIL